jgi:hypothetical protein
VNSIQDINGQSRYSVYAEQWFPEELWNRILARDHSVVDVDQNRGRDGFLSRLNKPAEDQLFFLIDLNGVTTIKEFSERLLSSSLRMPGFGVGEISDILTMMFSAFNPIVSLDAFTGKAFIHLSEYTRVMDALEPSFIQFFKYLRVRWQEKIYFVVDNAEQLFEIREKRTVHFIRNIIRELAAENALIVVIEDESDFQLLSNQILQKPYRQFSAPLPDEDNLVQYFANFWNVRDDAFSQQTLSTFLKMINYNPVLAYHMNEMSYQFYEDGPVVIDLFKKSVSHFLQINQPVFKNIFSSLTNYQKRVLKALAVTNGNRMTSASVRNRFELNTSPYVVQGLEFLHKRRLIRKYNKHYHIVDPLIRLWLLQNSQ